MCSRHHYFLIYRLAGSLDQLHQQEPVGGVRVSGPPFPKNWQEQIAIVGAAYTLAEQRYPCHEGEYLAVIETMDPEQRRWVAWSERKWVREFREFEELMTA